MIFKYHIEIDLLAVKCPPEAYKSVNIAAFRWIFERMEDESNFQPLYFKNPQRVNGFGDHEKCQSLGLSMFDSIANAARQFDFLKTRLGETVYQVLGVNLAEGKLTFTDGVADAPNYKGHFTFHPSDTCIFEDSFQIIAAL